jgi:endogenous inhibitor of DNA gyrase (YacG/DUF329 family)
MAKDTKPCSICNKITEKIIWKFCESCNLIDLNKTLRPCPGYEVNKRLVRNKAYPDLRVFLNED